LSGVPSSIPATGIDGVILLMTFNRVTQTCHLVYRVGEPQMDIVRTMLSSGDLGSAIGQSGAQLVGEVNFDKDTSEAPDDSLQAAAGEWLLLGGGEPDEVVVTTSAADQAITREIATEQSIIIQTAFSPAGTAASPEYIQSPEAFPPDVDCLAITFVAPQPQTTRTAVVIFSSIDGPDGPRHFPSANSPRATVVFKDNAPEGEALSNLIARMTPNQFPIKFITLAVLTPPPDAGAEVRIEALIAALAAAGHPTADPRKTAGPLSQPDRDSLTKIGNVLDGVDEVIFLER
jgi:hypothetical protein